MARQPLTNGVHGSAVGEQDHAPPSTLAAQIVEQHATRRSHGDSSTFRQLLEEIRASPSAIESDPERNHQLVRVIANAGLDSCSSRDPFTSDQDDDDGAQSQTLACLDVIEIAVRRNPEILLCTDGSDAGTDSMLCFLLLTRLMTLMCHEPLQDALRRVLSFISSILLQKPGSWEDALLLRRAFGQAATDLVLAVSTTHHSPSSKGFPLELSMPTPSMITAMDHEARNPVAATKRRPMTLKSFDHALLAAIALIEALAAPRKSQTRSDREFLYDFSKESLWAMKLLSSCWSCLKTRKQPSHVWLHHSKTVKALLRSLLSISSVQLQTSRCPVVHKKGFDLVLQASSVFVDDLNAWHDPDMAVLLLACVSMAACGLDKVQAWALPARRRIALGLASATSDERSRQLPDDARGSLQACLALISKDNVHATGLVKKSLLDWTAAMLDHRSSLADFPVVLPSPSAMPVEGDIDRPLKRRKTAHDAAGEPQSPETILRTICLLLGNWSPDGLDTLADAAPDLFADLQEEQQLSVIELIGAMQCRATDGHHSSALSPTSEDGFPCQYCGQGRRLLSSEEQADDEFPRELNYLHRILTSILDLPLVQSSKSLRVAGMACLQRLVCHSAIADQLDLNTSSAGKYCLQGIRSSSRELRIAASRALPMFLKPDIDNEARLCKRNRVAALNFLRNLVQTRDYRIFETVILTLGNILVVCDDEESNLILLQFLDFLDDTNPFVSGLAHLELRRLAQHYDLSVGELLRPYWNTLAISVVKDVNTRPQKAQQVSDLLGINVNQLLTMTQPFTVPYLLMWANLDVLQRIASTREEKPEVWDLCMQPANLTGIISLLLTQYPNDFEAVIIEYLSRVNEAVTAESVETLIKLDPVANARETLKIIASSRDAAKEEATNGFKTLTAIVERRGHATRTSTTQARMTSLFFENHALGIMAAFSDAIESPSSVLVEKRRNLHAIEEMILIGRKDIAMTIPQIRACLQSALEVRQLCNDAFSVWLALISVVEAQELETLIHQTFAIIAQKWQWFDSQTQQRTHDSIGALFRSHGTLVQDTVDLIPSLEGIPLMSKFESQLSRLRDELEVGQRLASFAKRCRDENAMVIKQTLTELLPYLEQNQEWVHDTAASEQPMPVVADLLRVLLDACARFNDSRADLSDLCAQCLGIIGCVDPNHIETIREQHELITLSNFSVASEAVDFVTFLLEHVLVNAFHSVSNPRAQGFLAYVMQELLRFCGFTKDLTQTYRTQGTGDDAFQRWVAMPETVRNTLMPFLSSHYVLTTRTQNVTGAKEFPIYAVGKSHAAWLGDFTLELLQNAKGDNAKMIFSVLARVIRGYDHAIASLLLPFAAANVIIDGTAAEAQMIGSELLAVLQHPTAALDDTETEKLKQCSGNVFQVVDYLSRWLQEKKKTVAIARSAAERLGRKANTAEDATDQSRIKNVESVLAMIPPKDMSLRAQQCGSHARALLHWEQHIRDGWDHSQSSASSNSAKNGRLLQELHSLYMQIDEPDGIDGISAHMVFDDPKYRILEHRRAGRWQAAQSWYELQLRERPGDLELNRDYIGCLKEAAQFGTIIKHAKVAELPIPDHPQLLGSVSQAAWSSEGWDTLDLLITKSTQPLTADFNVGMGAAIRALRRNDADEFDRTVSALRAKAAKGLSAASSASLQACHEQLLQLHALHEAKLLSKPNAFSREFKGILSRRLDVLGSSIADKQYLLSIRRAVARVASPQNTSDLASMWVKTARLARKALPSSLSYDAVYHATALGDEAAKIEQAKLLWNEGEHKKAISSLSEALNSNTFFEGDEDLEGPSATGKMTLSRLDNGETPRQNWLLARAQLLHARWLDDAGQTQSEQILNRYRMATYSFQKWEKGFYYLGRFYNKLLESEKSLPPDRQSTRYLGGEIAKLMVENFLRSATFGCKNVFQTLPKLLTLWLELGDQINKPISKEVPDDVRSKAMEMRPRMLDLMNKQTKKYAEKIAVFVFYTALPQMVTRISHPNAKVWEVLSAILVKVASSFPQQALWSLLAVVKSKDYQRARRGMEILNRIKERSSMTIRNEGQAVDLRDLVARGQMLSDELLRACEVEIEKRFSTVSLTAQLGFKTRVAPCPLVVPWEKMLTASLPTGTTNHVQMRAHRAFPATREAVTISSFDDTVLALSSLQRPRRIVAKGSDGRKYALLCKPRDDLRKDQRLMEFNAMINRALKKDAASAARQLNIKTYAVTPLNEAHGVLEWVDGLKPLRDILIALYKTKGIKVDYNLLVELLNSACANPPETTPVFTRQILGIYRPVLHEWFTEHFAAPDAWYAARNRYSRSAAVTSMVGYALGLGDRHGENVSLVERDGGVFHVDFNCLFDKGLTFEKPELVPFRLTHNMVDAMGITGVEGFFRRAAECTMRVMREQEDALLTILETFVWDPTADFVGARKKTVKGVPETPREVLQSVQGKVQGYMNGESLKLSLQGHVDALIRQATDPARLAAMYIGWCAFL